MKRKKLEYAYKIMMTSDERAILDKYSKLHQRSINQSIRLAIAGLGVVMENELKESGDDN
tara:strand:- start:77 stop:256 length:180 start_codon:yes stop_codon:yes gene_type:complete